MRWDIQLGLSSEILLSRMCVYMQKGSAQQLAGYSVGVARLAFNRLSAQIVIVAG